MILVCLANPSSVGAIFARATMGFFVLNDHTHILSCYTYTVGLAGVVYVPLFR